MKKILFTIILVIAVGVSIGFYFYFQKPIDTRDVKATVEITASALVKEFSDDESIASKKYVDQIILVSGKIVEVKLSGTEASVMLQSDDAMAGVTCSFYSDEATSLKNLSAGSLIKIKGKCTGKLIDVVLNNCSLEK